MANNKSRASSFWIAVIAAIITYVATDSIGAVIGVGFIILIVGSFFEGTKNKQKQEQHEVETEKYAFNFDALSPAYKSQLLKQQFDYFFKYKSISNSLEFYCAEDELDGYHFSFWVEYLVENTYSSKAIRVKEGDPICIVYISSNKGKSYGHESFTIHASMSGAVTGLLKGVLQKNCVLFRIKKEDEVVEVVEQREVNQTQEIPQVQTISFEDALDDLVVENGNIEVEKLEDVLKWEMPDVDDIEMPEEDGENSAYDASLAYHATITNLSDFDWYKFKAVCFSSTDDTQKEVKLVGNVKIGTKTLLSSRHNMFYLEGENAQGEQKRFRPFALEKDSDITVTTIFIERS